MTKRTKSLYDRLGGLDAVNALTESWVARVETDDRVNTKIQRHLLPRRSRSTPCVIKYMVSY
jgi:truncated hemoglobin YjbI